jgi:hypothetical protein
MTMELAETLGNQFRDPRSRTRRAPHGRPRRRTLKAIAAAEVPAPFAYLNKIDLG